MDAKIPIIVVGYNRPKAMERLLNSLLGASYPGNTDLVISIDGGEVGREDGKTVGRSEEVKKIAAGFEWPYGEKRLIFHESNLGLRKHVLSCGDLSKDYDGVIVLEDDLYVSPGFYQFTLQAFKFYKDDPKIAGISLYSHAYNETAQFPFIPVDDSSDVFFFRYASSWGQFWSKEQWKNFRTWYDEVENRKSNKELLPANIGLWPENSWKKYFIEYIIRKDLFFVYPRKSMTTIFGDEGTNIRVRETFLHVPLWQGNRDFVFTDFDNSNAVYDTWCEILPDRLKRLCPAIADKDFEVDLYGMKSISEITKPYLLSARPCINPAKTFGREMKPHEANVIHDIPGNVIFLGETRGFHDPHYMVKLLKVHEKKELSYWYPIREYHFWKNKLISTAKSRNKLFDFSFVVKKAFSTASFSWKYFFGS